LRSTLRRRFVDTSRGRRERLLSEALDLRTVVLDFARGMKDVDAAAPIGRSSTRTYRPGIGPLSEARTVALVVAALELRIPESYRGAAPMRYPSGLQICDLVIPGSWAIEFKMLRPFGDNGIEAEHWSEHVLHPYIGNVSAVSDALKLSASGFAERRAIVVFGYEHEPPVIRLDPAVRAFERIAEGVLGLSLEPVEEAKAERLIHPVHQRARVFGWQIAAGT